MYSEKCLLPLLNSNHTCIVIQGGLTLYGNSTLLHDQQTTYHLIKSGMTNGSLTSADSSIVRLTYLSDGNMTVSGPTTVRQGSDTLNTISIAAIASVVSVFVFVLIVARRFVSQKHKAILLQQNGEDGPNDSMHLVEIEILHNTVDKHTELIQGNDDLEDDSLDDSVSTSTDADFNEDASEVIVLNELGEELWLSLGDNKNLDENTSSTMTDADHSRILGTDQSSVHSQTFDAWLYSDDSTFV